MGIFKSVGKFVSKAAPFVGAAAGMFLGGPSGAMKGWSLGSSIGGIAGSLTGGSESNAGYNSALSGQQNALNQQWAIYNDQVRRNQPYANVGNDALPEYYKMLGLSPGGVSGGMTQEELALIKSYNDYQSGATGATDITNTPLGGALLPDGSTSPTTTGMVGGVASSLFGNLKNKVAAEGSGAASGSEAKPWDGDMAALDAAMRKQEMINSTQGGAGAAPDLSPLAQWQLQQTNRSQARADSARGLSGSGGASARESDNMSAIAGADYQNNYQRILDALKIGGGAVSSAGQYGNVMSGAVGNNANNQGNLNVAQGNMNGNLWSGIGQIGNNVASVANSNGGNNYLADAAGYVGGKIADWWDDGNSVANVMNSPNAGGGMGYF